MEHRAALISQIENDLAQAFIGGGEAFTRINVLTLDDSVNPWRLHIDSSHLKLADKIKIEKKVIEIFRRLDAEQNIVVNFRKPDAASAAEKRTGPVPVARKENPFGLRIEKRAIPLVRSVIVVASGKGGVGKSTIAVNLAAALARSGKRVGLLDADIYGPSAPLMLGLSGAMQVNEDQKLVPKIGHGVKVASFGFLSDVRQALIWRGPLIAKAFEQFCYDVAWGDTDYLVIDLPPGTGDIQLTMIERLPIHGAIIVTTPQDVALIDAHKALSMFETLQVPVLGFVENMAFHSCTACGHVEHIFGEQAEQFAKERDIKKLASLPLRMSIRKASDAGTPVATLGENHEAKIFHDLAALVAKS